MNSGDELLYLRLGLIAIIFFFALVTAITMQTGIRAPASRAAAAVRRGPARLIILAPANTGIEPGTAFDLAGEMTIGRDARNGIVLGDASISGRHAAVAAGERGWRIADLGSTNGTLVNGAPIDGRGVLLRGGEEVTVGSVVFRFQR
ncbi:hypothetical protein AYO38_00900 [bacterium SCGC AG-212-C10]|nr:hypothetical protein AYO38_00900 [bacterium SCGC AG-212-C10]